MRMSQTDPVLLPPHYGDGLRCRCKIAPSVIQRIMRHAQLSTTQLYIHPDESAVLDAINTLNPNQNSPVN